MEKIKLKDGSVRYRECYYLGIKKINGPCFKKITDAKTWKSRVETERLSKLSQGEHYFEIQNVLFGDYANKWLDTYVKANCVFRTHQGYDGVLKAHLLPRFEKKLLGHTKIDMTMRYAHFSPNHLQSSLRFMNMVEDERELRAVKSFIPFLDHEEKNEMNNLMIIDS